LAHLIKTYGINYTNISLNASYYSEKKVQKSVSGYDKNITHKANSKTKFQ